MSTEDRPYTERTGGSYIRQKDGSLRPEVEKTVQAQKAPAEGTAPATDEPSDKKKGK